MTRRPTRAMSAVGPLRRFDPAAPAELAYHDDRSTPLRRRPPKAAVLSGSLRMSVRCRGDRSGTRSRAQAELPLRPATRPTPAGRLRRGDGRRRRRRRRRRLPGGARAGGSVAAPVAGGAGAGAGGAGGEAGGLLPAGGALAAGGAWLAG